jgi:hypothetical protein
VASVPALIVEGRWLKGFGASGLTADDSADATAALVDSRSEFERVRKELEAVKKERDEALAAASALELAREEASNSDDG